MTTALALVYKQQPYLVIGGMEHGHRMALEFLTISYIIYWIVDGFSC
jgi:hypothetical protein